MADTGGKAFLERGGRFQRWRRRPARRHSCRTRMTFRQAIHIILGTARGERVMRPDFGAGLQELVFEPINTTTMALAQHHVQQALIAWEPRIDSIAVAVSADPVRGRLMIDVHYRVRATNTFYNLVYPFYLLEANGS